MVTMKESESEKRRKELRGSENEAERFRVLENKEKER